MTNKDMYGQDRNENNEYEYYGVPSLVDQGTLTEIMDMVVHKASDGMTFVEVGVRKGGSLCYTGMHIKEASKKIKLYGIDVWTDQDKYYDVVVENITKCGIQDFTELIWLDSIEASRKFDDNSIDFLFLDGNHCSPYVDNEVDAWLPKMKINSILAGHDFCSAQDVANMVQSKFPKFQLTTHHTAYLVMIGEGII